MAGRGGQTKREITKSHSLLWDISGARILMYHEEHSLLNGHFTHFFMLFIHYSKTQVSTTGEPFTVLLLPLTVQAHNQRRLFLML